MKKLHYYGSLLLLSIAGVTSSFAQDYVRGNRLEAVTAGQEVMIYSISGGAYIRATENGIAESSNVTNDCVFTLESAGNVDGEATYYLKNKISGNYLGDQELTGDFDSSDQPPSQGDGRFTWWTGNTSEAFQFFATRAVQNSGQAHSTTEVNVGTNPAFVFYRASEQNQRYMGYYGDQIFLSPWTDTNAWYIYEANEGSTWQKLQKAISTYFPNGFTSMAYPVGTNPGQISQALYNEIDAIVKAANEMTPDNSEADLEAATENLTKAKEKLDAGINPVVAGYYYIVSLNNNGGMYADIANGGVKWSENYAAPSAPTVDDANYIWQVEDMGEGQFAIKNFYAGSYIGTKAGNSDPLPLINTQLAHVFTYQANNSSNVGGYFNIYDADKNGSAGFNTQPTYDVVYWGDMASPGNNWRLIPVDESALESLKAQAEQNALNVALQAAYSEAHEAYVRGREYTSDATKDGQYLDLGIAPEAANLFCNAPDSDEGTDIGVLVDGDATTFFHTDWHGVGTSDGADYHYIQATFPALSGNVLVLKFTQRLNGAALQGQDGPQAFDLYVSTDGTNFTKLGNYPVTYNYSATAADGTEVANATAIVGIEGLPAGVQAIRFAPTATQDNRKNGLMYFSLSEFHVYEGAYDPDNSFYNLVDATFRSTFEAILATAQTELNNSLATQATIDELKAATAELLTLLPDPDLAQEVIDEAQALYDSAVEGTDIGYFRAGGKDAFQAAINEQKANVQLGMTRSQIDNVISAIEAAEATFNTNLILPEAGQTYVIRSLSGESFGQNEMVFLPNYGKNQGIQWSGYNQTTESDSINAREYINYLWTVEDVDGLNMKLRNIGTGLYINEISNNNAQLTTTDEPTTLSFRYGRAAGVLNIVVGDGLYMNLQNPGNGNSTANVVSWNSANGTDNSAFTFEVVRPDLYNTGFIHGLNGTGSQFVTLPYEISGFSSDGILYSVAGVADNKLYFEPYDQADVIEAGVPFLYVPNGTLSSAQDRFYFATQGVSVPEYATEPGSHNGLIGAIYSTSIGSGFGVYYSGNFTVTTSDNGYTNNIGNCSGYLGPNYPTGITPTSDMISVDLPSTPITSIDGAVVTKNEKVDVYTTTGVLVRKNVLAGNATKGLPAGIYIVGSQKVLVK